MGCWATGGVLPSVAFVVPGAGVVVAGAGVLAAGLGDFAAPSWLAGVIPQAATLVRPTRAATMA